MCFYNISRRVERQGIEVSEHAGVLLSKNYCQSKCGMYYLWRLQTKLSKSERRGWRYRMGCVCESVREREWEREGERMMIVINECESEWAKEGGIDISQTVSQLSSRHYLKHPHISIIMAFNQMWQAFCGFTRWQSRRSAQALSWSHSSRWRL